MNQTPFLAAICANPDDDAPRLVYADWLDEHGDPRGEFIRVQVELAALCQPRMLHGAFPSHFCKICKALWILWDEEPGFEKHGGWSICSDIKTCGKCCDNAGMGEQIQKFTVNQRDLFRREAALLAAHEQEWLAELPEVVRRWRGTRCNCPGLIDDPEPNNRPSRQCPNCHGSGRIGGWRRGFIEEVEVPTLTEWTGEYSHVKKATWTGVGPLLVAATPVRTVRFGDKRPYKNFVPRSYQSGGPDRKWRWYEGFTKWNWFELPVPNNLLGEAANEAHYLPDEIFIDCAIFYDSEAAANNALSRAMVRWARQQNEPRAPAALEQRRWGPHPEKIY